MELLEQNELYSLYVSNEDDVDYYLFNHCAIRISELLHYAQAQIKKFAKEPKPLITIYVDLLGCNGFGSQRFFQITYDSTTERVITLNRIMGYSENLQKSLFSKPLLPEQEYLWKANQIQLQQLNYLQKHSVLSSSEITHLAQILASQ